MKNKFLSLIVLMLLSCFTFQNVTAQICDIPAPYEGNTGVNMTVMLLPTFVQSLPISGTSAYIVAKVESGMVVGSSEVNGADQTSLTLWGDDTFTEDVDGALTGEIISFELVDGSNLYAITPVFGVGSSSFVVNGIASAVNSTSSLLCSADSVVSEPSACDLPIEFSGNTGSNMTVMLTSPFISSLPISSQDAYLVAMTSDGLVVGSEVIAGLSQTAIAIWGDDTSTLEVDGAAANEPIGFQLVDGLDLYDVDMPSPISYTANDMVPQLAGATLVLNCSSSGEVVEGCTDASATNYNSGANLEDDSCEYVAVVPGCVLGTVYITEAHGKGDPEDYIEIYNSGDTDCSLLGFMLDDEQPFGDL
ncbi:MAG: lamin tail domain-containing protein, partial [Flavobacteriales bacterium]|nr:lamin tail domain-containing protein [Flavobacteriales bacterium]